MKEGGGKEEGAKVIRCSPLDPKHNTVKWIRLGIHD